MKKEVDSFKVGKRIPACQLCATAIPSTVLTDLHQIINLNGAKEPFSVFIVYRHRDSQYHQGIIIIKKKCNCGENKKVVTDRFIG